jgi:hypothetical protein
MITIDNKATCASCYACAKIPGPGLGQTQIGCCDYTGKWDPIPINNCISNINAYPNDKSMHIFASTDKDSILSQK